MNTQLLIVTAVIITFILLLFLLRKKESFGIPLRSSSAWDWNLGPGYGAGYGTGYAMWGIWPADLPDQPWQKWMWGRRPLIFKTPYTPVPQIDYNETPQSNYTVSMLPTSQGIKVAIDGKTGQDLQLDRNRNYFFHIYTPDAPFVISDGHNNITPLVTNDTIQLNFTNDDPPKLYYGLEGISNSGGIIYLNSIR